MFIQVLSVRRALKWSSIVGSLPVAPLAPQAQLVMSATPTPMSGLPASSSLPQYSASRPPGVTGVNPQQFKPTARSVTSTWQPPAGPSSRPQGLALPAYRPLLYQPFPTPPRPHGHTYPIAPVTISSMQGQQKAPKDTLSPYSNPYGTPGWPSAQAWATKNFSATPPPSSLVPYRTSTPITRPTRPSPAPSSLDSGPKPGLALHAPGTGEPSGGNGSGFKWGSEGVNTSYSPADIPNPATRPPMPNDNVIAPSTSTTSA
jgi:hypothetical protein